MIACKASNIEATFQSKLGKKIWILLANAYPPFQVQEVHIYEKVYPTPLEVTTMTFNMMTQAMMFAMLIAAATYIMKEALKE